MYLFIKLIAVVMAWEKQLMHSWRASRYEITRTFYQKHIMFFSGIFGLIICTTPLNYLQEPRALLSMEI